MKTKIAIVPFLLIFILSTCIIPQKTTAQGVSVGFQVFYDELSPYGTWVDSPDYGYVWVPDVAPGFTPYSTNGYWVFTDEEWTWISNYSWGWAPFHYGRWYIDRTYGAMWVPDYEWGPGWVTWRRSGDFYGWAPIGPGVSISIAYGSGYYIPNNQWTFVRDRDFGRTNINKYYVNNSYNVTIINNSTVINNTRVNRTRNVTYNAGPERADVERHAGRTFTPVSIKESSKPGQNLNKNQLQVYRPQMQKNVSGRSKPAPARVERLENVKTTAQRKSETPLQRNNQGTKDQPSQQQRQAQPSRQQQAQPQKQQQSQPARQQQAQPQKQQQSQPARQQQPQPQKQQQSQPSRQQQAQPQKQQQSQPSRQQQDKPSGNGGKEKESQQGRPPKLMGG
ncbi:MAG: hypothetical protein NTW16_07425 [Bacteroidetes bacterium]|nr:hypothetical protein [Bacteroidota bacterium]